MAQATRELGYQMNKETLFHIDWGDGDTTFVIAKNKKDAISKIPDGKDMVNYIMRLDGIYSMIYKAGITEAVEFILRCKNENQYDEHWGDYSIDDETLQEKLKKWGVK
jgi:hypothetical protein